MKLFTTLLIPALLLATSFAWAEVDEMVDLRYCLALQSNDEIAKCAGETAAGAKGKPYTKDEVDMILSKLQAAMPVGESLLENNKDSRP